MLPALLAADFDLKRALLTLFVLALCAMGWWFTTTKAQVPQPFNWLILLVLILVAAFAVYRFIQGL